MSMLCRQGARYFSTSSLRSVRLIKTVPELRAWRRKQIVENKTVGLVPTMGALHQGHLNLVSQSCQENDNCVVSVFVNPSQFAPHEDLNNYPRTLKSDIDKLEALENDMKSSEIIVFLPSVADMYPSGITLDVSQQRGAFVEVKGLSEQLEGFIRPQFFRGVATIVTKLLNIVVPERAYFGQKDVQQSIVVKRLVKDLLLPTEIKVAKTSREPNGLAMSSRNEYLTTESRERAKILFEALSAGEAAYKAGKTSRQEIIDEINRVLKSSDLLVEVEYIALSDKVSLEEVDKVENGLGAIISAAIRVPNKDGGKTRIIDNIILD
ncbi:pantoate--beta-alanine ligase PAN6 [Sugiyamaella lignohabitans]|uniref:Pantoate--beta-alanine ligase n=1 Tax=Sugiyamaella lignohabitans TaxID=796027 RepID=A0A167FTK9_9ASCO|nr:pantoate--beta-alanine ligase PAN6 [Sugiyamaella lignohabitans]ANB15686.1 pantoate--beta-alanine ligase PAN6 [Sugiyamaella lignohabitans]